MSYLSCKEDAWITETRKEIFSVMANRSIWYNIFSYSSKVNTRDIITIDNNRYAVAGITGLKSLIDLYKKSLKWKIPTLGKFKVKAVKAVKVLDYAGSLNKS